MALQPVILMAAASYSAELSSSIFGKMETPFMLNICQAGAYAC